MSAALNTENVYLLVKNDVERFDLMALLQASFTERKNIYFNSCQNSEQNGPISLSLLFSIKVKMAPLLSY